MAGRGGRTTDGDPTRPPRTVTYPSHIPSRQKCPRAAADMWLLTSCCPMSLGSNSHSQKGSRYASWEILLQSLGWAPGPPRASGYFKGRTITGEMIPGDAGRCHIAKQALLLSSPHPGPTQVRFSVHMGAPARPWGPSSPSGVKHIFSRCLKKSHNSISNTASAFCHLQAASSP